MNANTRFCRMLRIVARDRSIAVTSPERAPEIKVMSEDSMATSVPVPMAEPTSAWARAGASLMPSPTMPTTRPSSCNRRTSRDLCSGITSASTRPMPTWRAMAAAVRRLSPVIITTSMPRLFSAATAAAEPSLRVSATPITAAGRPSTATNIGVLPSLAKSSCTAVSGAESIPASLSKRRLPTSTRRPPTSARTPWPVTESNSVGSSRSRPRSWAPLTLAAAIVKGAQERGLDLEEPTEFDSVTGQGVRALVGGRRVLVGNRRLLNEAGIDSAPLTAVQEDLASDGKTPMFVAVDGRPAAVIGVADTLKEGSAAAVAALKSRGIDVVMMTGDNRFTAAAIARQVGIGRVLAEVMPEHKSREVRRLQEEGRVVGMVGDGINDAPALAQADVGSAIGTGTDVAIESSDITLVSGALSGLVTAIRLSRATMRNIRQNLFLAFVYNSVGIPVAVGALYPFFGIRLSPIIAAAAMALSSLSVVTNANRLRRFTPPRLSSHPTVRAVGPTVEVGADHEAPQAEPVTDPVCGMTVDPATAAATITHHGVTHHFCSAGCRDTFVADPDHYSHEPARS